MRSFVLFCCLFPITRSVPTTDVHINTNDVNATIRGYQFSYGKSFRGIRYAKPPIGSLRFQYSQKHVPDGIIEALKFDNICTQRSGSGDEDCLFINVFTPVSATNTSKLPVYIFFHGGGFVTGSGYMRSSIFPNLVNRGNIVMVTVNYRLGPFGFFSSRQKDAAGNWAVSDWVQAISWVNKYIDFFGGDKTRVTIGGQSAGAEATSSISMLSEVQGKYQHLIMESATAFSAAVMSYSESTRNTSSQLAIDANCATNSSWQSGSDFENIVRCLRNLTTQQIVELDRNLPNHRMKWGLVQDTKYFSERLEYLAMRRPTETKVLMGNMNHEWLLWERKTVENDLNSVHNTKPQLISDFNSCYEMIYWTNQVGISDAALRQYVSNKNWSDTDYVNWEAERIKLWSEMVFIGPVLRDASYFRYNGNPVYLYSLDWLSPAAYPDITDEKLRGCPHSWDLQYILNEECNGFNCTAQDDILREYFTTLWVNFVKYGNPTPPNTSLPFKWLLLDKTNRYLSLQPNPTMKTNYHSESYFWACTAPTIDGYKPPFC